MVKPRASADNMYWSNFLHIYQPPTQSEAIVRKVTAESYRPLVRILQELPHAKVTLNISGCLTQQLARYGLDDVILGLRQLAERGQVELTGSAIYHPILPLIPATEMRRQIELNTQVNRHYFGEVYAPQGFSPPEMCYSYEVAQMVANMGYRWIIVDEIGKTGLLGAVATDSLYQIQGLDDLYVFFRERPFSAGITYGKYPTATQLLAGLGERTREESYLLTGTDGEVYGHHRPGQELLLKEIYATRALPTCTISELMRLYSKKEPVLPLPSSWSTWEDEMAQGVPYSHWSYPGNELQELQWQLTRLSLETIAAVPQETEGYLEARNLLDKGLHSCQFWWASCRPWWSTDMIHRGATLLMDAVLQLAHSLLREQVLEVQRLAHDVMETARHWQDTGKARLLAKEFLDSHPQVVAKSLTFGPKEGVDS